MNKESKLPLMTCWTKHFVAISPNPYISDEIKYHLLHHNFHFPGENDGIICSKTNYLFKIIGLADDAAELVVHRCPILSHQFFLLPQNAPICQTSPRVFPQPDIQISEENTLNIGELKQMFGIM